MRAQLAELEAQFHAELDALGGSDPLSEVLETLALKPKRTQISVTLLALGWAPVLRDER